MRTALVLLFLLALAAIPGALLPQRALNARKVDAVHRRPPHARRRCWTGSSSSTCSASFWFTAIYLLLFISLVGCLAAALHRALPRAAAAAGAAPRNLSRLPHHHRPAPTTTREAVAELVGAPAAGLAGRRTGGDVRAGRPRRGHPLRGEGLPA